MLGSLAIVGMPPFGLFISEFFILTAAFSTGNYQIAALVLVSVSVVFGALLYHFQGMLTGDPETPTRSPEDAAVRICCVGEYVRRRCWSWAFVFPSRSPSSCTLPWGCCNEPSSAVRKSRHR